MNASLLPHDLSPWGMFQHADIVVQIVIVGLAIASVVTWTVCVAKGLALVAARRRAGATLATLNKAKLLGELAGVQTEGVARRMLEAALAELRLMADSGLSQTGVKDRVAQRLQRIEVSAGRSMARGTGLLATIGATAPFVGLFGTVWGIMNSFVGISRAQTTNLAVVAPGIAEALLATAIGLVAAIPAVIIYNFFSRGIAAYRGQSADLSAAIQILVSRELDRPAGQVIQLKAAE